MKRDKVIMVRLYLTESEKCFKSIMDYLIKEAKLRGVTVFRGISGYGASGIHTTSLVDLSLDLPITIEFFDHDEKINPALEHLATIIKSEHMVSWEAFVNE